MQIKIILNNYQGFTKLKKMETPPTEKPPEAKNEDSKIPEVKEPKPEIVSNSITSSDIDTYLNNYYSKPMHRIMQNV